jgi:hypothetical protein
VVLLEVTQKGEKSYIRVDCISRIINPRANGQEHRTCVVYLTDGKWEAVDDPMEDLAARWRAGLQAMGFGAIVSTALDSGPEWTATVR